MDSLCTICAILSKPKHQILLTDYWSVSLSNSQAYFGRAYVTLREHKASLGVLSTAEWRDFEMIAADLEQAYKKAFGAEPLNWGCYMNKAYREDPARPHVHWHVFPRYRQAPILDGVIYDDVLYGEHYKPNAGKIVDDVTVEQIAATLKQYVHCK